MATWPYNGQWPRIRLEVLNRDRWCCQIRGPRCQHSHEGDRCANDVDHIISWAIGGAGQDKANLRAACPRCNRGRRSGYIAGLEAALNPPTPPPPSRDW